MSGDETRPDARAPLVTRSQMKLSLIDADHLAELLSRRYARVRLETRRGRGLVSMSNSHIALNGVKLNRSTMADGLSCFPQDHYDAIFFVFPTASCMVSHEGRGRFSAAPGSAFASEGATCRLMDCHVGSEHYGATIERGFFAERLARLLDRPFSPDILFEPVLDPRSGPYNALMALLTCVTAPEFGAALSRSPLTAERMPATIADFMLENWRHTHSEHFDRPPPRVAPRHVKLAIDAIEADPGVGRSADDLARLCGISLRALQYGFRDHVGTSITGFQRRARLGRAQADLLSGADTIETVALRWGFTNAGRFSRYFKAAHGVFPSEIRRP